MRRVVILGPPGSGKSTLARQLGERHGLPVFHLDQIYFRPGWVPVEQEIFATEVARIAALPDWVIDGNYTATIAPRLAAADTVIYLDVPTWLLMARISKRTITSYARERPEMAAGCPERFELEFLRFALAWNRTRRARSVAVAEGFPGRGIVLRSRRPMHDLSRRLGGDA
ncbi:(d)CMP kinase [Methylobacterium brachythecii]|uniref:ATPase AAA n=1 Tax=Methylobacterium brachythecii TaxID=1176177 RepID=A0A7W6AIN5_9HYPH|nr:(d)CMP kinase [Methylobacterium brachythecii]MBB3900572.1 adenylate kinase family enzyme [Methylobacterium brachythecii]GLS43450.1 ATPase AAA [Methylobacterium brachythecii]